MPPIDWSTPTEQVGIDEMESEQIALHAELSGTGRLGEYEEQCACCREWWHFWCDLADNDYPTKVLKRYGALSYNNEWVCIECHAVYLDVTRVLFGRGSDATD